MFCNFLQFGDATFSNSHLQLSVIIFYNKHNICNYISFATGIPALICFGKTYLDYSNTISSYCSKLSYVFYIVHFPIVVLCQYFISLTGVGCIYNFVLSLAISTIVTCSACYIIDKNTIISILFGLKK